MADTHKVILTEIYPKVEQSLAKKQNTDFLKQNIGKYLDRNIEKLSTIGPVHRILFNDEDAKKLYMSIELEPMFIKKSIQKISGFESNWQIMSNPFNSAIMMAIRYYKLNKNDEMVKMLLIYLTLSMYPSLHFKYFKYGANENVMNFTINNLSNKYKVKQTGTIYQALIETTFVSNDTNTDLLIRGNDKDLIDYIFALKTRLNSLLKKIAIEYYKNKEQNLYLNTDSDNYDENNYHEADNNTYLVERLTNNVVLSLVVNGPNIKYVNVAAKFCQVSVSELRNYVNSMINDSKRQEIRDIVESILFLYLYDSQNSSQEIHSTKFLLYCSELYKKSNTTDKNIIKIKNILDKWLEELGTYKKTQRIATINNFRRALFIFFVISIQASN